MAFERRKRPESSESALQSLADEELMALVAKGQARAFETIYDRHGGAAFSLAYRMCGSRSLAEDVAQEAFLSIWRAGGRYDRARGSVRTWVLGIVHNRAIDALRRTVVHERRRAREEASTIRGMLETLPDEQSRVIELAYFGGFTHSEIAEMLGAPIGTVKGRMRLGLEKLRGQLAPQGAMP